MSEIKQYKVSHKEVIHIIPSAFPIEGRGYLMIKEVRGDIERHSEAQIQELLSKNKIEYAELADAVRSVSKDGKINSQVLLTALNTFSANKFLCHLGMQFYKLLPNDKIEFVFSYDNLKNLIHQDTEVLLYIQKEIL